MPILSHFGICVRDLDTSVEFYRHALGFQPSVKSVTLANGELDALLGHQGLNVTMRFIRKDGVRIELLQFDSPAPLGDAGLREMNTIGLTHLSFQVDDIDTTTAKIEAHGGATHHDTRTSLDLPGGTTEFVMCNDPDGVRIELKSRAVDWEWEDA